MMTLFAVNQKLLRSYESASTAFKELTMELPPHLREELKQPLQNLDSAIKDIRAYADEIYTIRG